MTWSLNIKLSELLAIRLYRTKVSLACAAGHRAEPSSQKKHIHSFIRSCIMGQNKHWFVKKSPPIREQLPCSPASTATPSVKHGKTPEGSVLNHFPSPNLFPPFSMNFKQSRYCNKISLESFLPDQLHPKNYAIPQRIFLPDLLLTSISIKISLSS